MKQELQMRLAVAKFMQESLEAMAVKKSNKASGGTASSNDEDASGAQEVCFIYCCSSQYISQKFQ